ncbi:MAG: phosphoenolpyruvate--protein phosphotransferase [Deltaproteobacteria bacterium]|nr:phosphoenolpyruvate--protein phosphotransferase [Deltaproteobacteria bacterium]
MTAIRMRGIAASPGIAIGTVRVIDRQTIKIPRLRITVYDVKSETDRLMVAIEESRQQLHVAMEAIRTEDENQSGDHSLILQAHLLMLEDDLLIQGTRSIISSDLVNAEWALSKKTDEIKQTLAGLGDDYFRERAQDITFVSNRVLRNLMGHATQIVNEQTESCIIIADKLSPVETTQMVGAPVLGFATEAGTRTGHTAIMAQALGIPAVVGVERLTERIGKGDTVIVDGIEGAVIIRPEPEVVDDYEARAARHAELEKKLLSDRDQPATTADGVQLSVLANIEFPAEAAMALDYGAEGVGLYRTEFLYLNRPEPPTEEEQLNIYRTVTETLAPRRVVFRTFDLGADKLPNDRATREVNPALGLRAIRLGLKNRTMFKEQLRALLRASNHGNLDIMFPMISGVGELRQIKAVLEEARKELGESVPEQVRIGCMIELPSAVLVADQLAREVDFFSIGTNDLIQYSLAIDRTNDHVAYLYTPFHPAIMRAVRMVIAAGKQAGIKVAMCGGLAAEPLLIPLLIGMGLRTLSMAPTSIPTVKAMIRTVNAAEAEELTAQAFELTTALEIEDLLREYVENRLGPDFPRS